MKKIINWFQERWKLESATQVVIVLLVFALTGTTILLLRNSIFELLGYDPRANPLAKFLYYLLILPIYNLFLLAYGFLFGQFKFFWEFEKKSFNRMAGLFKKKKSVEDS